MKNKKKTEEEDEFNGLVKKKEERKNNQFQEAKKMALSEHRWQCVDELCHQWVNELSPDSKTKKLTVKSKDIRNFRVLSRAKTNTESGVDARFERKPFDLLNVPKFMLNYVTVTNPIFFRLLWKLCEDTPQYSYWHWMAKRLISQLDALEITRKESLAVMEQTFKNFDLYFRDIKDSHPRFEKVNNDRLNIKGLAAELKSYVSTSQQPLSKDGANDNERDLASEEE